MMEGDLYTYSVVGMLFAIAIIIYFTVYSSKGGQVLLYKADISPAGHAWVYRKAQRASVPAA